MGCSLGGGAFQMGPSGGQNLGGAYRGEGLVVGEHVPDRLAEAAGEVDLGDSGAALFAEAVFGALVAVVVEGVGGRRGSRPRAAPSAGSGGRAC